MKLFVTFLIIIGAALCLTNSPAFAQSMTDYCTEPPFISRQGPPLVMLVMGRDHKLYYEAYNDASDLDGDGVLDVGYKHSIDYYGYFDCYKCYTYNTTDARFNPERVSATKYCGNAGEWSGNFLNWLTMSRVDTLRKVFYGGHRSTDSTTETVLEGVYIPQDAHSWGKEYAGSDTKSLTPFDPPDSGKRHLFCVTSTSANEAHRIRVAQNSSDRIWNWASSELAVCCGPETPATYRKWSGWSTVDTNYYMVRVKVCDTTKGVESNCQEYPSGVYKPVGILQKYGTGSGTKVCSKTFKPCTGPTDCGADDGDCIELSKIYFGLLTGSYSKNLSGGVLRRLMGDISDEIDTTTGVFNTSVNTQKGNIILTLERLTTVGFNYSNYSYDTNCGWITTGPLTEGKCKMWGDPLAEIMYEGMRYLADKNSYTSAFHQTSPDTNLNLPTPNWNRPFQKFPSCSRPAMLVISDINPNYDSDQVPGTYFGSFSTDLNDISVATLASSIGANEGINSTQRFIGQSGSIYDNICSEKTVNDLSQIRGLCPEDPTKRGSYYAASLAYYGKTKFKDNFGSDKPPNVTTYSVALASPIPDIRITAGSNTVTLVPLGKSVSGCLSVYGSCAQKCTLSYEGTGQKRGLRVTNCSSDAYCPSNQIVDFYVESINPTQGKFRINFEDVEQGADHDMDSVIKYEYEVIGSSTVRITITTDYGAGCIDQVMGFFISGTTEDGLYLPVKDGDVGNSSDSDTPATVSGMPLSWTKDFTVSTGGSATLLKNPLWYAAKWGGFDDINSNNKPDLVNEWDRDGNGVPDTYFLVTNPLRLEQELNKAIGEILKRVSSGTAVSVLSTSAGGEGSLFQAYFNPSVFDAAREVKWVGYLNALWVDQYGNLREDNGNQKLVLTEDPIIEFDLDVSGDTVLKKYSDTDGDGDTDILLGTFPLYDLKPLWEGGKNLAQKPWAARTIYTYIDYNKNGVKDTDEWGSDKFDANDASDAASLRTYLGATTDAEAEDIIEYIRGDSKEATDDSFRDRRLPVEGTQRVWKLGDIVYSTPTVVGRPAENYHLIYGDTSYIDFVREHKDRKTVIYVGANDGMLHAFSAGTYHEGDDPSTTTVTESGWYDGTVGTELWAYIPYNLLRHLKWLTDPGYCHACYVDLKAKVSDAKIFTPSGTHKNGWGTVLIGAMRLGGKEITGGPDSRSFRSAYFAIDITVPDTPNLLWEFTDSDLGFTTSYPAIFKVEANWYVIFGSGPTTFTGEGKNTGNVYILKLEDGTLVKRYDIALGYPGFMASPITIDLGLDYNVDIAYIGASYKNSGTGKWEGKIYRIGINEDTDPASWNLSTMISLTHPITIAPAASLDPFNRLWLFFGTGRFFSGTDKADTTVQRLYGVWDPGTKEVLGSELNNITTVRVADGGYVDTDNNGSSDTTFQSYLAARRAEYSNSFSTKYGWYLNMTSPIAIDGERAINNPTILGNIVLFTTFKPEGNICKFGGNSYLYGLYYETGTAYKESVIGFETTTIDVSGTPKQEIAKRTALGPGMPTSVVIHSGQQEGVKGMVQLGTGVVETINITPPSSPKSRVLFWREKME